ncbi:MAG: type I-C CRISPR-associated protein Cas5c [bacterium]
METFVQVLEVWGDFACFTRPELKVERFSYPVITPSAARGIFEAIYWKPEFRWEIRCIEVLSPLQYIALRRNEVKDKVPSERTIHQWMSGKSVPEPIWADGDRDLLGSDMKGRTQRQTMALKDVRYRIHAEPIPWYVEKNPVPGITAQFIRRAKQGKCFYQPYFGCREFPAYFRLVEEGKEEQIPALTENTDIGWMLYDVFDLNHPGTSNSPPAISLFYACIENGILKVPPYNSNEVKKSKLVGGINAE